MSTRLLNDPTSIAGLDLTGSAQSKPRHVTLPAGVLPAALLLLVVALPILAVALLALAGDTSWWRHLADTLLLEYATTSLLLCFGVVAAALAIGTTTAWLITSYDFPGRSLLEWALVLPLAMPAYVLAYAYTDFLQFTGPLQTGLRALTGWGWRDYWFPPIHSLGGAILVLSLAFYPYVYITARAAFLDQAACTLEVARTLGCSGWVSLWRVGLPMARPALAAGATFVLMETLADFGAVRFFEVPTFTTGIYRAWYAMASPGTAAQLALVLMLFVAVALLIERSSRGAASFAGPGLRKRQGRPPRLPGWKAGLALLLGSLPLLLGFVLPALVLVSMATGAGDTVSGTRLVELVQHTVWLGALATLLILCTAVAALYVARHGAAAARGLIRLATLGYAVPGVVIAVGLLVTVTSADHALGRLAHQVGAEHAPLLLSGSIAALLYGYLVRFFAVAWNPLDAGLTRVRGSFEDAARTLGCRPLALLGRVHLPLLRTSLLAAGLLVVVDVMKELPATMILRPFNMDTLAVEAFQLATTERLDGAAIPSLLIVAIGLLPVVLLCRVMVRDRRAAS
jgi:iron(III) transport system permease protein